MKKILLFSITFLFLFVFPGCSWWESDDYAGNLPDTWSIRMDMTGYSAGDFAIGDTLDLKIVVLDGDRDEQNINRSSAKWYVKPKSAGSFSNSKGKTTVFRAEQSGRDVTLYVSFKQFESGRKIDIKY